MILGLVLVTLGGGWWGFFLRRNRSRRRLMETGTRLPGVITDVTTVSNEYWTSHGVRVRFPGVDGVDRQHGVLIMPVHAEVLRKGTEVEVVVDTERPDRAILDPASYPEVEPTWRARLALSRIGTLVEQQYFMTLVCTSALVSGVVKMV